jgi:hypothetical protein
MLNWKNKKNKLRRQWKPLPTLIREKVNWLPKLLKPADKGYQNWIRHTETLYCHPTTCLSHDSSLPTMTAQGVQREVDTLPICWLWVQCLNISSHCPQSVPETISELSNNYGSTLPHCLHKWITTLEKHRRPAVQIGGGMWMYAQIRFQHLAQRPTGWPEHAINIHLDKRPEPVYCTVPQYTSRQKTWTSKTAQCLVSTFPQDSPIRGGTP